MIGAYVGFHPRASLAECWRDRKWSFLGHVEAWGYTADRTWLFYDPRSDGTHLTVTHHHDEVEGMLAARFATCETILRFPYFREALRVPFHPTMTCAAQVGHLFGLRAYGPRTLQRMLLARGAEVIHATQGRPGHQGGA